MPEGRDIAITRVALLELKDEQRLVQEGFKLLDEKRILLAAEIQRQLRRFRALRDAARVAAQTARAAFEAALQCHGLDELTVYPPLSLEDERLTVTPARLLGLELIDAQVTSGTGSRQSEQPVNPSMEARQCAHAHRHWLVTGVELAACSLNLRRLTREYVRTERRARALENILLPEIDAALKRIDEQLESMDQEEIARLRHRYAEARSPQEKTP